MRRVVLTGAPGSGKTALLRALELEGLAVVEEAATDVIALDQAQGVEEPWTRPDFVDRIVALQRMRQARAVGDLVVFDRSPVCALALARFLGQPPGPLLAAELDRIADERVYDRSVLFANNLGFCTPTAARRISFEDSLRFETVHREAYLELGFDLTLVPPVSVRERVAFVLRTLEPQQPPIFAR